MFFMSIKSIKTIKRTKRKQTTFLLLGVFLQQHKEDKTSNKSDFLPLRCFYEHENAAFFVSHTKKHKKHKNHKDANKRRSDFPLLRCLLYA